MIVNTKVTYTVNNGADITAPISLVVADDMSLTGDTARFTLMSLAADQLVSKGQICVTGFEIVGDALAA